MSKDKFAPPLRQPIDAPLGKAELVPEMDSFQKATLDCPEPLSACCESPFTGNTCEGCGVQSFAQMSAWMHGIRYELYFDPETRHIIDIQSEEEDDDL